METLYHNIGNCVQSHYRERVGTKNPTTGNLDVEKVPLLGAAFIAPKHRVRKGFKALKSSFDSAYV